MASQPRSPQTVPMGSEDSQYLENLSGSVLPLEAALLEPESDDMPENPEDEVESETNAAPCDRNSTAVTDTIKILVGPLHNVFLLHRIRICAISPYFATLFASTSTLQVILPDIEPNIFQLVVDWLHTGQLTVYLDEEIRLDQLIDVYLLGDLIGCHALKNCTIDLIQDTMYRYLRNGSPGIKLSLNQIRRIFADTINAEDAPLRTFVAALVSYRLIFGDKPERLELIFEIPGFLKDFAAFQRSSLKESDEAWYRPVSLREDPRIRGFYDVEVTRKGFHICTFHVHEKGDKCFSISNCGPDSVEE